MHASPPLSPESLDSFYDDTFANDPGCQVRAGSNFPSDKDRKKEELLAETWGINIIKRFIEPRGKHILDLRCRTGALTSILQEEGAEVIGVEPFSGNANYARQVRRLPNIVNLPFSRFHLFPAPSHDYFDIVNILPHHVLAHVLSPRRLLEKIFKVLKPGGYIFLDEKDVLQPVRHKKQSALDSGPAHQFHLTLQTSARYLSAIGFTLLEYEIDKNRSSDFRHMRIVAQKPKAGETPSTIPRQITVGQNHSTEAIRRRLWWLERTWNLRLTKLAIEKKSLRMLKKIGF
jgi:SAM-dependent methyltransferase